MKVEALRQWRKLERQRRLVIIAAACAAIVLIAIVAAIYYSRSNATPVVPRSGGSAARVAIAPTLRLSLPPPDLLRPITPEEAVKQNAERAFSGRPDTPASPFKLDANASTRDRALECLTQAVYYEAATEGANGQRAVAQIVLNRMRHPAYPSSVCGVVYQGAERPTGCQFTFTCDGSLARLPAQSLWQQARKVATEALGGKVFAPIGHSTHYHADYVLPYWADSLDKSVKIGRHIFYRLKSSLGASGAFRQRYAGIEPSPPAPSTVEVSLEAVQNAGTVLAAPIETSPLQVAVGELVTSSQPKSELVADAAAGKLLIDGDVTRAPSQARRNEANPCAGGNNREPLKPLRPNDVRAQSSGSEC
ncbi:MAG TPA: cell wall hydrolase [Sphingomicrobium sp.]|jgi:spore germination cell wall hydrolase CwlJ-like protein